MNAVIHPLVLAGCAVVCWFLSRWFVGKWSTKYESGKKLAVFRMVYAAVQFWELVQLLYMEQLVFDPRPGFADNDMPLNYMLVAWCGVTLLLGLGLFTRYVVFLNFMCNLAVFSTSHFFEYHVDYAYTGINFLMLFSPISACWSLDAWREGRKEPGDTLIPALYSQLIVLFGIAVIYADSCLWKLNSKVWSSGLGVCAPASHPGFVWIDFSWLLDNWFLAVIPGYITLVFELAFVPCMWHKKPRLALTIVGLLLHIGILVVFPIPWFALCMLAIYIPVLPTWRDDVSMPQPISVSPKAAKWLVAVTTLLLVLQCNSSLMSLGGNKISKMIIGSTYTRVATAKAREMDAKFSRPLFGITTHPVFMDHHLKRSNRQFLVTAQDEDGTIKWHLPTTTPEGIADYRTSGRFWVNWRFRVTTEIQPDEEPEILERHILFWRSKVAPDDTTSKIVVEYRDIPYTPEWETGLLTKRRALPWKPIWEGSIDDEGDFTWSSLEAK